MSVATTLPGRTGDVRGLAALALGTAALILLFLPECQAALRVWSQSTAYGHCYLVIPIAIYLAWERRDALRGLTPRPTPWLAVLGLPLIVMWFAAERLGIMEGRQLAALGFAELLALVVLGWQMFRVLLPPLLYLVFLVPFGAFVTPLLQAFTARFIDVGLTVLGIPHFVNEMFIDIPAGMFFVAEACAGLRFLIASIAFGVLYALLNYQSPWRRAGFIAASILVPIVANGFRALGIVVLGQVLGSAEAAAADHLIYGWVFFSFVMLLLSAGGLPFREATAPPRPPTSRVPAGRTIAPWPAAVVLLLAALGPGTSHTLAARSLPPRIVNAPIMAMPTGCTASTPVVIVDRAITAIQCARAWEAIVQSLPDRSTTIAVNELRARMIGDLDPEETATETLHDLPSGNGDWQVLISRSPGRVIGTAVWVRGEPARGGLSQRLAQASDSVNGTDHHPAVMAISTQFDQPPNEGELRKAVQELTAILSAQTGLTAAVVRAADGR